jgi:hypothetical protein
MLQRCKVGIRTERRMQAGTADNPPPHTPTQLVTLLHTHLPGVNRLFKICDGCQLRFQQSSTNTLASITRFTRVESKSCTVANYAPQA